MEAEEGKVVKPEGCKNLIHLRGLANGTSPPGLQRHIEVFSQVQNIEGKPTKHEKGNGGKQQVTPTDIALLLPDSS